MCSMSPFCLLPQLKRNLSSEKTDSTSSECLLPECILLALLFAAWMKKWVIWSSQGGRKKGKKEEEFCKEICKETCLFAGFPEGRKL